MIIIQDYVTIFKEDFTLCNSKGITNGKVIALYCKIKSMAQQKGFCEASNAYFADFLSCSDRQIRRYLSELEEKKLIQFHFERNGNRIINRTIVIAEDNIDQAEDNIDQENQKCPWTSLSGVDNIDQDDQICPPSIYSSLGTGVTREHIFEIINKYNLNKNLIKNMIVLLNQDIEDINKNEKVSGNYNFTKEEFELLQKLAKEGKL